MKWRYQNDLHYRNTHTSAISNPLPQPSKSRSKENGGGIDGGVRVGGMAEQEVEGVFKGVEG